MAERYPGLTAVRSNDILCEVMSRDASKRRAVELLCERYGVMRECSVAFGDGPNDIDMLQAAGRSFAMANAEESVKQAATDVSPWSNVENGVARTLDLLLP